MVEYQAGGVKSHNVALIVLVLAVIVLVLAVRAMGMRKTNFRVIKEVCMT
jgi:hypothetical protein